VSQDKPRFIRRNGRIIPIRAKGSKAPTQSAPKKAPVRQKKAGNKTGLVFTGSAATLGGAYLSAFSGSAFAEFGKEAQHSKEAAKGLFSRGRAIFRQAAMPQNLSQSSFLKKQAKTFTKAGAFQRARGARIGKLGFLVGASALLGGSFLLDYGVGKFFKAVNQGKKKKAEDTEFGRAAFETAVALPVSIAAFEYGKKRGLAKSTAAAAIQAIMKARRAF